jgi:hypothetical protein
MNISIDSPHHQLAQFYLFPVLESGPTVKYKEHTEQLD